MINLLILCSNPSLAGILSAFRNILFLIQIIGPILLIISLVYNLIQLMSNPDDKKIPKKISNSFMALIFVFFIPLLVTVTLNMVDDSTDFGACWKDNNNTSFGNSQYIEIDNNKRTNIINNGDEYEKGVKKTDTNNSNSDISTITDDSSNNSSVGNVQSVANKVIFLGDSRTVQMYAYLTGDWSGANYSSGGVHVVGSDVFVAQGSMGLKWMKSTGIPEAYKYLGNGSALVILMGVNDLFNQNDYISYINSNVSSWTSKGAKVYFVTVNPTNGKYSNMNSKINSFNSKLKSNLSKNVGWINTHDNMSFVTSDGLHYNKATSNNIYKYIKSHV